MFAQKEFGKILEEVAQKTPTPGGGTVAAASGALGCALTIMVCNYTKDKIAKDMMPEMESLKNDFVLLMLEDARAFEKYVSARKTKEGLPEAMDYCIQVPLKVIKNAVQGLEGLKKIYPVYNKNLKSDFFTATYMFECAIKSAREVVEVNLTDLADINKKSEYDEQVSGYLKTSEEIIDNLKK